MLNISHELSAAEQEAWMSYEGPYEIEGKHRTSSVLGSIRHAFFAGYLAAKGIEAAQADETRSGSAGGESPVRDSAFAHTQPESH